MNSIRDFAGGRIILLALAALLPAGCRTAPITNRNQVLIYPEAYELQSGQLAFGEVLKEQTLSTNQRYIDMVERVGQRIATVANRPDYAWEFRVFASPEQNAFCLPGGKVGVYEGIIEICENEAELAVVMSHEVAHALQRHGGERMTRSTFVTLGESGVKYVLGKGDEVTRERVLTAYGLGAQYGAILPFSRKHELEADHVGLLLMAQAGYDPSVAPGFWNRFGQISGPKPPEFFSTHPSDDHRAAELQALQGQAATAYQASVNRYGIGEVLR